MSEGTPHMVGNCAYCGETEWQNHRFCLQQALRERDEARAVARTFQQLLGGHAWDTFNSQPATKTFPWLQEQG